MRPQRAPWWRRSLGAWGVACAVLVVAAVVVGVFGRSDSAERVQLALLTGAAVAYLVGVVRSPD